MHDSRSRFLLLLVAVLALLFAPVAVAQDQGQQQGQDQAQDQQRVRDRIHVEAVDVEIAHNDTFDENGELVRDSRVVVETVFSDGPGWLVVYALSGVDNLRQDEDGFRTANQCGVGVFDDRDADADDRDDDADADDLDADADDGDADADVDGRDLAALGIIGYSHLQNGVNRGIEVPVDATRAAETLCLQVHRDAGEIGVFEFPGPDSPVAGGLVINVVGGLLDEQGQPLEQDVQQDQFEDQDQDMNGDEDGDLQAGPGGLYLPLLPAVDEFDVTSSPMAPGGFPVIVYPQP
jgi:hypothetical protein